MLVVPNVSTGGNLTHELDFLASMMSASSTISGMSRFCINCFITCNGNILTTSCSEVDISPWSHLLWLQRSDTVAWRFHLHDCLSLYRLSSSISSQSFLSWRSRASGIIGIEILHPQAQKCLLPNSHRHYQEPRQCGQRHGDLQHLSEVEQH
jgi:hypothetical protein